MSTLRVLQLSLCCMIVASGTVLYAIGVIEDAAEMQNQCSRVLGLCSDGLRCLRRSD